MRLPEIQEELRAWAKALGNPRLAQLADEMTRKRNTLPAAPRSKRMTPAIAARIKSIHASCPEMTQLQIANIVGVNPGRVSETLYGKRE